MTVTKFTLKALDIVSQIENKNITMGDSFNRVYSFTTENIKGYLDSFDLKGRSVLTVGSSGDQIINAAFRGCTDITCMDINPFAEAYFHFKKAAIMALDYEDFFKFLVYYDYPDIFKTNNQVLNEKSFSCILPFFENRFRHFWEVLYSEHPAIEIYDELLEPNDEKPVVLKKMNYYLTEENYYKTRDILKTIKPTFITTDIKDIHNVSMKEYDYIFLSNIADYANLMYYANPLENILSLFIKYRGLLTDNGKMLAAYLYSFTVKKEFYKVWSEIYNMDRVESILNNKKIPYELLYFIGTLGILENVQLMTDAALILKK